MAFQNDAFQSDNFQEESLSSISFTFNADTPLYVQFTDTSIDNPIAWAWNFGDYQTSTDQNPVHAYPTAGNYTVSLTVTNDDGTSTVSQPVTVTGALPGNWENGQLNGWQTIGDVSIVDSDIFGHKVLQCSSWGWTQAIAYKTDTNTTGIWEIQYASTENWPFPEINILSTTDIIANSWWTEEGIFLNYYTYGQLFQYGDDVGGNQPNYAYYGYGVQNYSMNTIAIKRESDGTTEFTVNGTSMGTINIPDEDLPNGTILSVGGSDSGVCQINSFTYTPLEIIPIASFTTDIDSGHVSIEVNFTNTSQNSTHYLWDFGDGSETSTDENPTHTFGLGTWDVTLTAYDDQDRSAQHIHTISVTPVPLPSASFTMDVDSGTAPLTVNFTNTSQNATAYYWSFGDGYFSGDLNPSHTFSQGDWVVYLIAYDNASPAHSNQISHSINVSPAPSVEASFTADTYDGTAPLTVHFTNTSQNAVSWEWSFGGGHYSYDQNPLYTFSEGSWNVTLTVWAADNSSDQVTRIIYSRAVGNAPFASFTAEIQDNSTVVQFTDTSYTDNTITEWYWDFGDGTVSTYPQAQISSNLSPTSKATKD